jgi:ubiquinone/menaquinone biosynthesis C-methylase UbiE
MTQNQYRELSRRQWEQTAEGWHRWEDRISELQKPIVELVFELARVEQGSRVLEIAGGDGTLALQAARRVGASGYVLCTDFAGSMVAFAGQAASEAGLDQMEARVMDAEKLALPERSFDAVLCMASLMLFADPEGALREAHRVLKRNGTMAAVVFTSPERSPIFSIPARVALEYAGRPMPAAGQPGLFALGDELVLRNLFSAAGFRDVQCQTVQRPVLLDSAAQAARMVRDTAAAIGAILSGMEETRRREAWEAVEQELKRFEGPEGFRAPSEFRVIAGTR